MAEPRKTARNPAKAKPKPEEKQPAQGGMGAAPPRASAIFDDPKGLPVFVLCIGKGRKGKSYWCRWFLQDRIAHAGWAFGITFAGSAYTGAYDWLPRGSVVDGFSEERLEAYMGGLKAAMAAGKMLPPNFVWLDDLGGILRSSSTSEIMENFWRTARHTNTNVICCEQHMTSGLPPVLRLQCDYALMWYSDSARTNENLWLEFGQAYEKKAEFVRHFRRCCRQPYAAMLYVERIDGRDGNFLSVRAPAMEKWPTLEAFTW